MSEELASSFAEPAPEPDWSDREAVIAYIVEGLLSLEGGGHEVPPRPLWNRVVAAILENTAER